MTRSYNSSDFSVVSQWVAERGLPPLPTNMLPENGVVYMDPDPSAAAWVYLDKQAGVGFPHWMITKKGMSLRQSRIAVAEIFKAIQEIAKANKIHTLVSTVHQDSIARECVHQFGWQYLGQGATLYLPCHL